MENTSELKECPECAYKLLHKRTTKTTVSMPVSIRCGLCSLTIEMQNWGSLVKFWNDLPRPQFPESSALDFDKLWIEFERFLEPHTCDEIIQPIYARNTVHIKNWLRDVCKRHGTQQSKLVPIDKNDIDNLKTYAQWHGSIHENNCPQDDMCDCKYKPINESVNKLCDSNIGSPAVPSLEDIEKEFWKEE